MKALVTRHFGEHPQMAVEQRPEPVIRPGHSLIQVHATTVNPLSNQIRHGLVPQSTAPLVLSNDGAGVVLQSDVFAVGQRVAIYGAGALGITEDGLQQQLAVVRNDWLMMVPETLSLEQAAALPINYVSALQAIRRVGQLQPDQTVLISGGSGSVGSALIQLCKAYGAIVLATVSSVPKAEHASRMGADQVIDLSSRLLSHAVYEYTNSAGVDLAFDTVGGELTGQLVSALKTRGALVSIGFAGGTHANIDLMDVVVFEKRILGFDAHLETDEDVMDALAELYLLAAEGKICPHIDSVYPLGQFEAAYARLESRQAMGPILLRLED
ncbi:quinone oxidoreductase family protein [Oceanobacter mangrovi]|uniref:quinone oxidoreductase family protein n=1 Tax=Oceanobacter mangrovi TaxID=2862510 RepID=UPI001C8E0723|nr:zinc-binding alcohol dehydrogenase family protein [Oceanobacter mangrovi]